MFVTIQPQAHPQKSRLELDKVSIPGTYNMPTKKLAPVVCFACRKEMTAGEKHNHSYSR
jgi:hypothetical protein